MTEIKQQQFVYETKAVQYEFCQKQTFDPCRWSELTVRQAGRQALMCFVVLGAVLPRQQWAGALWQTIPGSYEWHGPAGPPVTRASWASHSAVASPRSIHTQRGSFVTQPDAEFTLAGPDL